MEVEIDDEDYLSDSDRELQEALATGKIAPGVIDRKQIEGTNNVRSVNETEKLSFKLEYLQMDSRHLKWIERLDITNGLAPLAPELATAMEEHKARRERQISMNNSRKKKKGKTISAVKTIEDDPVHNDFVRELNFSRQGQEAVLKALPRLKEMKIPTKRPDDYFAEMAKSDGHMEKVAKLLLKKQVATEKSDQARKMREQKKFAKETQIKVLQERQKAKKDMLESVKKFRKGKSDSLDFMDEKLNREARGNNKNVRRGAKDNRTSRKRQMKDDKYGFGGKKKRSKWNTKESTFQYSKLGLNGRKFGDKSSRDRKVIGKAKGKPGKKKRPGKEARKKMKTR